MSNDEVKNSSLIISVSPSARVGERIRIRVKAVNVGTTILEVLAPDTVLISKPDREVLGKGTFEVERDRTVQHVKSGTSTMVEITVSAGRLTQVSLCKVGE